MSNDSTRHGDWMQTATGRKFWPLDPRPEEVHIEDIAHALSNVCRFGGHCKTFYSVAEHSVRVSLVAPNYAPMGRFDVRYYDVAMLALLHDAAEAYVGDMIRPLKRTRDMATYCEAEDRVFRAVALRFGLDHMLDFGDGPVKLPAYVKHADEVLLATEARDIMGGESAGKWFLRALPLTEHIEPMPPAAAKEAFLVRYEDIARS